MAGSDITRRSKLERPICCPEVDYSYVSPPFYRNTSFLDSTTSHYQKYSKRFLTLSEISTWVPKCPFSSASNTWVVDTCRHHTPNISIIIKGTPGTLKEGHTNFTSMSPLLYFPSPHILTYIDGCFPAEKAMSRKSEMQMKAGPHLMNHWAQQAPGHHLIFNILDTTTRSPTACQARCYCRERTCLGLPIGSNISPQLL